jgi:hypothetical protein
MILICIILLIGGFFFPPAWLALAGYGIYIFASRKSRRDDAVEDRVKRMISAGKDYAVFSDLYFEAARSYAIAKGANAPEQDAASARVIVNGRSYFVVFVRAAGGGGTAISVKDSRTVERELESFLPEELRTYR